MKYTNILLSLLLCLAMPANAESDYDAWLKKNRGEFQSYLEKNDQAFMQFLKQTWKSVEVEPAQQRDPEPKPPAPPAAPQETPLLTPPDTPVVVLPPEQLPSDEPDSVIPPTPAQPVPRAQALAEFDFYGHTVVIHYPREFNVTLHGKPDSKRIAAYWEALASSKHETIVTQLKQQAAALALNDWGTALLFNAYAQTLHADKASQVLTSWFLLVKAGYDARVAYNQQIYLLLTSDQEMFGVTYFPMDAKQYYAVNMNGSALQPGEVFTYQGQHESGTRALDFSEPTRFPITGTEEKRTLTFRYNGQRYDIHIAFPERYVRYFSSYPQLSLPNYFRAGLPAVTAQSLLHQLRPIVAGQTETEATNRLLRFVQTAFRYKTDDEQFHEENYLFPLETLHYPYSDCEDRAALFAWLTESLLGLDVVILNYPGHVATAIAFDSKVSGDQWRWKGKSFVVADPTYINANIGQTIPQYAGVSPTILEF